MSMTSGTERAQVLRSFSDASVLACAALFLVSFVGGHIYVPRGSQCWMALVVVIWYWTTTSWAADAKTILTTMGSDTTQLGFPLLAFWLTFVPQILSSVVCCLVLWAHGGAAGLRSCFESSRADYTLWICGGAALWYGQFFTVESLVYGTPALTFVVKALEPLSTALLAVPVLRKTFDMPLFVALVVACAGVVITVMSGDHPADLTNLRHSWATVAGVVYAILANVGFSSRACIAKKAISQLRVDPFRTYSMMTIAGAQAGILPLIAWLVVGPASAHGAGFHPFSSAMAVWTDPRFSLRSWFFMSLSYTIYQLSSVLILSCLAVETHAVLVAGKQVLVVIVASVLIHANLTPGIVLGLIITSAGVYFFSRCAPPTEIDTIYHGSTLEDRKIDMEREEDEQCRQCLQPRAQITKVPMVLGGIVSVVVILGIVTPLQVAYSVQSS